MIAVCSSYGELGNRLLTFSNVVAFAIEHGVRVINPGFAEYADYFELTSGNLLCQYPKEHAIGWHSPWVRHRFRSLAKRAFQANRAWPLFHYLDLGWKTRFEVGKASGKELVAALKRRCIFFVSGLYFLDRNSMVKHAAKLRDIFRPLAKHEARVRRLIGRARLGCDVLVGVHIRHGDYAQFRDGIYYYPVGEYTRLMGAIEALFPGRRVHFLICSNERLDPRGFARFKHSAGTGHLVEDMYSLAACDYIVGVPSTFSRWASFYGSAPLCVMNYREERMYGITPKPPALSDFRVRLPTGEDLEP